jgi:hypothetical protein
MNPLQELRSAVSKLLDTNTEQGLPGRDLNSAYEIRSLLRLICSGEVR